MKLSDLTVMARDLAASPPGDQSAPKACMTSLGELRSSLKRCNSPAVLTCLDAVVRVLDSLATSPEFTGREQVKRTVCRMLYAVGVELGPLPLAMQEESESPGLELDTVPAETPAAALPDTTEPAAALPTEPAPVAPAPAPAEPAAALPSPAAPAASTAPAPNAKKADMAFGRMLIELGHVSRKQVANALKFHRARGPRLGECLLLQGAISPDDLLNALKIQDLLRASAEGLTPESLARHVAAEEGEASATAATSGAPQASTAPAAPTPNAVREHLLGEVLLGAQMISCDQLDRALELHQKEELRIGEALVRLGALTELDIQSGLKLQKKLRHIVESGAS